MHHCDSFLQRLTVALIEPCVCCALRAVLGAIRCEPAVISICAFCIVTAAFTQTVLLYLYTTAVVYTGFGARQRSRTRVVHAFASFAQSIRCSERRNGDGGD